MKTFLVIMIVLLLIIGFFLWYISVQKNISTNIKLIDIEISGITVKGQKYYIKDKVIITLYYEVSNPSGEATSVRIEKVEIFADVVYIGNFTVNKDITLKRGEEFKIINVTVILDDKAAKNIAIKYLSSKIFGKTWLVKIKTYIKTTVNILGIFKIQNLQTVSSIRLFP